MNDETITVPDAVWKAIKLLPSHIERQDKEDERQFADDELDAAAALFDEWRRGVGLDDEWLKANDPTLS
jgi:hypothetical protein